MSNDDRRLRVTPRLIIGLTVIVVGVAFLLDQMGRFDASEVLRYWPLAMVALGLTGFFQARDGGGQFFGVAVAVCGMWFLADNMGWVNSNPFILLRYFWPGLLLAVGASMVWRSLRGPRAAVAGSRATDRLNAFALLSGYNLTNASQGFVGGQATAVMGGCEIDLRQAKLAGEEAVVEVFAMWGGIEIKVPESWAVVGQVTPILGGFESKAAVPAPGAPRLVVSGSAIMGGVEVHN
jgi:predicted membrane protein